MNNKTEAKIIMMYSLLTGITDKKEIYSALNQSDTFLEITNGNDAYLYEGYVANLLDIARDLKEKNIYVDEANKITPENIRLVNRARKFECINETSLVANI